MAQKNWEIFWIYLILFVFCETCKSVNSDEISYKVDSLSVYDSVILMDDTARYRRQAQNFSTTTLDPRVNDSLTTAKSVKGTTQKAVKHTTAAPARAQTTANNHNGLPTASFTTPYPQTLVEDNHMYYSSIIIQHRQDVYWYELEDAYHHDALSDSHRVAVVVKLSFRFPFYGHVINNVTIATGGFLYMSPFLHQWLTATQYVAPLMANFDTSIGNTSDIYYKDYGDKFVVEWRNVYLKDQNYTVPFKFQTILHRNGSITFVYKSLPLQPQKISTEGHPVKIGISDAFYIDSTVLDNTTTAVILSTLTTMITSIPAPRGYKRRTIYEYHRVSVNFTYISTGTVVFLNPLATCNIASNCLKCVTQETDFKCKWCPEVSRCSDGIDWHRQEWLDKGCLSLASGLEEKCPKITTTSKPPITPTPPHFSKPFVTTTTSLKPNKHTHKPIQTPKPTTAPKTTTPSTMIWTNQPKAFAGCVEENGDECTADIPVGVIVAVVLLLVAVIGGISGWCFYAYKNPQSSSGQWLISHRPSQMKETVAKMKFWKKSTPSGEKYKIESEA